MPRTIVPGGSAYGDDRRTGDPRPGYRTGTEAGAEAEASAAESGEGGPFESQNDPARKPGRRNGWAGVRQRRTI